MRERKLTEQLKSLAQKLRKPEEKPALSFLFTKKFLVPALLALFLLFAGTTVTTALAEKSLPGERLYSVKRLVERARLSLAQKPRARLKLRGEFLKRRFSELERTISSKSELTPRELKALSEAELSLEELKREYKSFKKGGLTKEEIRTLLSQVKRLARKKGIKKRILRQRLFWLEKNLGQLEKSL